MPRPTMTVDEWVATLSHLDFPMLLVEGDDDMRIYRWLQERVGNQEVGVEPVGGRKTLLSIYARRDEYAHLPVAFLADRDLWLFSGIPPDYPDIVWTLGYSIENDLYAGAELENLLNADEAEDHGKILDVIIEWFAFEVEEYLAKREALVDTSCYTVVPLGKTQMDEGFRDNRGFRPPNEEFYQRIKAAYQLELRGKTLFEILTRFLSASDREVKHSTFGLYEIALKVTPSHELMNRLMKEIDRTIAEHTSASR